MTIPAHCCVQGLERPGHERSGALILDPQGSLAAEIQAVTPDARAPAPATEVLEHRSWMS
jgi:hypothetical protein